MLIFILIHTIYNLSNTNISVNNNRPVKKFKVFDKNDKVHSNTLQNDILSITNNIRKENKMSILDLNEKLIKAAQEQANFMCLSSQLIHKESLNTRLLKFDFIGSVGENIARAYEDDLSNIMNIWMDSKLHKKNLLGFWKEIGIGWCYDKDNWFYLVELFGNSSENVTDNEKDKFNTEKEINKPNDNKDSDKKIECPDDKSEQVNDSKGINDKLESKIEGLDSNNESKINDNKINEPKLERDKENNLKFIFPIETFKEFFKKKKPENFKQKSENKEILDLIINLENRMNNLEKNENISSFNNLKELEEIDLKNLKNEILMEYEKEKLKNLENLTNLEKEIKSDLKKQKEYFESEIINKVENKIENLKVEEKKEIRKYENKIRNFEEKVKNEILFEKKETQDKIENFTSEVNNNLKNDFKDKLKKDLEIRNEIFEIKNKLKNYDTENEKKIRNLEKIPEILGNLSVEQKKIKNEISNDLENNLKNKISNDLKNEITNKISNLKNEITNNIEKSIKNEITNNLENQISNTLKNEITNISKSEISNNLNNNSKNELKNNSKNKIHVNSRTDSENNNLDISLNKIDPFDKIEILEKDNNMDDKMNIFLKNDNKESNENKIENLKNKFSNKDISDVNNLLKEIDKIEQDIANLTDQNKENSEIKKVDVKKNDIFKEIEELLQNKGNKEISKPNPNIQLKLVNDIPSLNSITPKHSKKLGSIRSNPYNLNVTPKNTKIASLCRMLIKDSDLFDDFCSKNEDKTRYPPDEGKNVEIGIPIFYGLESVF